MPINYSKQLQQGRRIDIFIRILKIWKGSLYKLIWVDLVFYLGAYYLINFIYRFALSKPQKQTFVKMVQFADEMKQKIPFFFILGFFVAGVIGRWIRIFLLIPWLQRQAFTFECYINGNETTKSRRLRRTVLRYLNLAWILQMRQLSHQIAKRFTPTCTDEESNDENLSIREIFKYFNEDSVIQDTYGKIITDAEIKTFESIAIEKQLNNGLTYVPEYWIPIQWATRLIQKCYLHKYVCSYGTRDDIIKELDKVRNNMQELQVFCDITIPLVYTQVVIIAVYSFFLCELFASQNIDPSEKVPGHEVDTYFPIFPIFEFLFLMGWLKVAMCVMNPFGDDDEDFQTSEILDINLDTTYKSVSGDPDMYPDNMEAPVLFYEIDANFEKEVPDNLEYFLDDIDDSLNDHSHRRNREKSRTFDRERTSSKCLLDCIKSNSGSEINSPKDLEIPTSPGFDKFL